MTRRDPQGLGRPVRPRRAAASGAVDRHQERDHADRRQQRRHRGHRRHLRGDDQQRRRPRCRSSATSRSSATCSRHTSKHEREDRAPDLPHAAHRQGHRSTAVRVTRARARRPPLRRACSSQSSSTMPRCSCIGAICFWSDCRARASRRSGASSRGAWARRSSTPTPSSSARLGVTIPTIFEIEGEAGFRDREEAMLAELVARTGIVLATGGGAVLRPANRERLKQNGTVVYLHADAGDAVGAHAPQPNRPLLNAPDPLARLAGALCAARRAVSRGRATSSSSPDREADRRASRTRSSADARDAAQA